MKYLLLSLLLLFAAPAFAGGSITAGEGGAASLYCIQKGGKLFDVHLQSEYDYSEYRDFRLCRIGKGIIGADTLFAARSPTENQLAVDRFFYPLPVYYRGTYSPPYLLFCQGQEGQIYVGNDENGNPMGLCKFSDGSVVDIITLFRGPDDARNASLAKVLR